MPRINARGAKKLIEWRRRRKAEATRRMREAIDGFCKIRPPKADRRYVIEHRIGGA